MVDLTQEQLVSLAEVPTLLPRRPNGRKLHVSAVYRWAQRGRNGRRLETIKLGGTRYTSLEALQRFGNEPAIATATPAPRRAAAQAAKDAARILGSNT